MENVTLQIFQSKSESKFYVNDMESDSFFVIYVVTNGKNLLASCSWNFYFLSTAC